MILHTQVHSFALVLNARSPPSGIAQWPKFNSCRCVIFFVVG